MEIQYHGSTTVRIATKKSQIVFNPASDVAGKTADTKKATQAIASQEGFNAESREGLFLIDGPGEYEFEDVSVKGVAAQPFQGSAGDKSATMYRLVSADVTVLFVGNINEKLSEDQLEEIGLVDILVVPVGGNGYTLDAVGAATITRSVEPKLVIPVFYAEDGEKYEVAPASLEAFTKELGAPVEEAVEKYKVKILPEAMTVQPLKVT